MIQKSNVTYQCVECGEEHTTEKEYTDIPYGLDEITIGHNSEKISNPFSGDTYELDAIEEAVYSVVKGAEWSLNTPNSPVPAKLAQTMFNDGIDWFKMNNTQAYMTLLD